MIVNEDIVIVDGWQFSINRDIPKIGESLGKESTNEKIKLQLSQTISSDYVKSIVKVEIEYEGEITSIKIAGENIEPVPEKKDGKYIIEKEIEENGLVSVLVKDKEEKYQIGSIKVSEITEDMEIWTKEDLELFRDRVNSGRTYEKRTVRVMADIDLKGNEINQWIPISVFKGTFDGQEHSISKIYINVDKNNQGLFEKIVNATVKNLYINDSNIQASYYIGTLSGSMYSSKIENVHISSNVNLISKSKSHIDGSYVGGIVGLAETGTNIIEESSNEASITALGNYLGGIAGTFNGIVNKCVNRGNIISSSSYAVGGIIGTDVRPNTDVIIMNTYNTGKIQGYRQVGGIAGIAHTEFNNNLILTNCYNIGEINGNMYVEELIGYLGSKEKINNCYTKSQTIIASQLGNTFTNDIQNKDGTWKYNNGYPILKWELE